MGRALRLARRGLYTTDPNPRVGCVIVKGGTIVGDGWHRRAGEPHAEIHALRAARGHARDACAYLTFEPCSHHGRTPPCSDALIEAGIHRAVIAMQDPNPRVAGSGCAALERAGMQVEVGLLQAQAQALNPGFVSRMRRGRPLVRAKIAASLDGRTAMASGESKWITSEDARADVQRWRARSSAIMVGVETVLADDPRLTVRAIGVDRQPLRVVLDSHLRLLPKANLLKSDASVLVITASDKAQRADDLREAGAEVLCLPGEAGHVDLHGLMSHLAAREVNELLLESGATLCGAMLQADLIDELILYLAPCLMGDGARAMFNLPGL
ncbi:MAG: bifunctional diaminohydroxyphosphoribosylaminopyrimidine deaminase/5-amino-6-(5-phosphoribosylamino)uracil reductase RibD, partial [Acidiferrobacterales bacterium]